MGAGGRGFESRHPDPFPNVLSIGGSHCGSQRGVSHACRRGSASGHVGSHLSVEFSALPSYRTYIRLIMTHLPGSEAERDPAVPRGRRLRSDHQLRQEEQVNSVGATARSCRCEHDGALAGVQATTVEMPAGLRHGGCRDPSAGQSSGGSSSSARASAEWLRGRRSASAGPSRRGVTMRRLVNDVALG